MTKRSLAFYLILTSLSAQVSIAGAQGFDPEVWKCLDTVAKQSAKLASNLSKAANACEKKKESGEYLSSNYCRTDFVLVTSNIPLDFAEKVEGLRERFTAKILAGCSSAQVAAANLDSPCGPLEGVTTSENLYRCIFYDAHGRVAANLEWVSNVYGGTGPKCRAAFGRFANAHMLTYLKEYHRCAKSLQAGRDCDVGRLAEKLSLSWTKNRDKMLKACSEQASIGLGGECYGSYTDFGAAAQCALDHAASEALKPVKMLYDFPFLPE